MNRILIALDNSPAARAVIAGAQALGLLLDADVEALHVKQDGERTARNTAEAAGLALRTVSGPVAERLVEAGEAADVLALAIGARGTAAARRPLGSTAAAVATTLAKPVLVVPPDGPEAPVFRRVLVPLEGTVSSSLAPRAVFELAAGAEIDVLALHVYDQASMPSFTDQPQHEQRAWEHEFVQRYCPWGVAGVRLETRVGRTGELIPQVAEECGCDLIALGWSQELAAGRAAVVRETLERSSRPLLLVPVLSGAAKGEDAATGTRIPTRTT